MSGGRTETRDEGGFSPNVCDTCGPRLRDDHRPYSGRSSQLNGIEADPASFKTNLVLSDAKNDPHRNRVRAKRPKRMANTVAKDVAEWTSVSEKAVKRSVSNVAA